MLNRVRIVKVLRDVTPNFYNLLKEARQIGDMEIVDAQTFQWLRERGFPVEVVEEGFV